MRGRAARQGGGKGWRGLTGGFWPAGMVKRGMDVVNSHGGAGGVDRKSRQSLGGKLCRCTGYQNIVKAIQNGADGMGK